MGHDYLERATLPAGAAVMAGRSISIWAPADDIAGGIVVADPDLGVGVLGDGATDLGGGAPDDLGVVAADGVAGIGTVVVGAGFGGPIADDGGGREAGSGDFEEIFAVGVVRAVGEALAGEEGVGPLLGKGGEAVGPDEGREVKAGADGVVGSEHFAGHVGWGE